MASPKKPAAKQRQSKRKAAEINEAAVAAVASSLLSSAGGATLDISKSTPKVIAASLLALLPAEATKQHATAKKLLKAFPLVVAQLDHRANVLARKSESQGTSLPIEFQFHDDTSGTMTTVNVPEDSFVGIFSFLNGREIVNASIVSKSWLSASRVPSLWNVLDKSSGLTNSGRKLNTTALIKLLGMPQFRDLKYLSLPPKIKIGKNTFKDIVKACPHIESLDIGFHHSFGVNPKDSDLIEAVERIPSLSSISINMWKVSRYCISSVAKTMGGNLLELKIAGDALSRNYISDRTLTDLADCCKNLKSFTYKIECYSDSYERSSYADLLTNRGVVALVTGCHRLEYFSLAHAKKVTEDAFTVILDMLEQGGYALQKIDLEGYPFEITGNPLRLNNIGRRDVPNRFGKYRFVGYRENMVDEL